jgi:protein deglycase
MRISCKSTLLVAHNTRIRQVSKVSTARQLISTYCVAALSASCFRDRSFIATPFVINNAVNAFIPTVSPVPSYQSKLTVYSSYLKMSTATNDEKQSKHVLVPIADGSEEIETACITDTLTRFGAKVTVASVKPDQDLVCIMSRGLKVMADCTIDDAVAKSELWDMIVLPGGMPGAEHLRDCTALQTLLHSHAVQNQKICGAICAAPAVVLASSSPSLISQLTKSLTTTATCYPAPAFRTKLAETGAVVSDDDVVVSGNIITSQGPATALSFSLKLGEVLYGVEKRTDIAKAMLTV